MAACRAIAEAVGSDSHTAFILGNFEHCLRIAREVDFPEDRVLNVTPRRLLDFLALRTGKTIPDLADF
ncbi:histidinol-phosphatase [Pantoea stewartii subsp. stewartii DC283]|uniref:Histidinol-phosphatase n=1 Tax=Pantoea stewartii subsp. stewartii DC283 TaxID=660596 RepID=H3RE40_PANSE|nr:histidinol-phosphatase [Pantoea stewartii subsp. stewartii DC283]EHU00383.1 putative PHP family hydrolase [Pantoea stewartii subsp. stewartii DC283]